MEVTITKEDVEKACASYTYIDCSGYAFYTAHGKCCPLANALTRQGFTSVYVSHIHAEFIGNVLKEEHNLTEQATNFTDEFDKWYQNNYMEGSLGTFVGRTIKVWED